MNQNKYLCENKGSDYPTILSVTKSLEWHIEKKNKG
jgi:hypothetical protein